MITVDLTIDQARLIVSMCREKIRHLDVNHWSQPTLTSLERLLGPYVDGEEHS